MLEAMLLLLDHSNYELLYSICGTLINFTVDRYRIMINHEEATRLTWHMKNTSLVVLENIYRHVSPCAFCTENLLTY